MTKKERLEHLVAHYADGNKTAFARMLGVAPQTISTWMRRNVFDVELIYSKCEDLSARWLLAGEGQMHEKPAVPHPADERWYKDIITQQSQTLHRQSQTLQAQQQEIARLQAALKKEAAPQEDDAACAAAG